MAERSTAILRIACLGVYVFADANDIPGAQNQTTDMKQVASQVTRKTDGSTEFCNRYGGIGNADQNVCCSADCGGFCGAANCELSPAGGASCCRNAMTQWCAPGTSAPCLLDMDWLNVVVSQRGTMGRVGDLITDRCEAYDGIDVPNTNACCAMECGEYCGSDVCVAGPGGSAACCATDITLQCGPGVSAPCLLIGGVIRPVTPSYVAPADTQTPTTTASVNAFTASSESMPAFRAEMTSRTPTSTTLQHSLVMDSMMVPQSGSSPSARQTRTTTVSVTTIASVSRSSFASDAKILTGMPTSTTPQAPIAGDSAARGHRSRQLLTIVLVISLVCCCAMYFVCDGKKAKVAVGGCEPDLEASQASSSPLMFKSPDARDLSIMAGSLRPEISSTPEQCIEPQPANASDPVPLVWDTPDGERTVYATKRKLGVKFHAKFPLEVKCQPEGHGQELGIHAGWILKSVNGVVVTPGTDIDSVLRLHAKMTGSMHSEIRRTPEPRPSNASEAVPLVWQTPEGERTVYATQRKLGVKFHAKFPLEVKCQPEGHGKELGIRAGWVLESVNGMVVTPGTDLGSVLHVH